MTYNELIDIGAQLHDDLFEIALDLHHERMAESWAPDDAEWYDAWLVPLEQKHMILDAITMRLDEMDAERRQAQEFCDRMNASDSEFHWTVAE